MIDVVKTPSTEGSVQGSPLSPLLSNIALDELDKELERRGLEFCRWADDCNIFVQTQRRAVRVMASLKKFIDGKLKQNKTTKSDKVKFLRITIIDGAIAISKIAFNRAMEKIKHLIPRGSHVTMEEAFAKVTQWFRGWASYFKMTQFPSQLKAIESRIRRRFRARFVKQKKRRRTLFSFLVKNGGKQIPHRQNGILSSRTVSAFPHKGLRISLLRRLV